MSDRNEECKSAGSERNAEDGTDIPRDNASSDWRMRENPYRGATAFDRNAIFTTIVALLLAALVIVTGLIVSMRSC